MATSHNLAVRLSVVDGGKVKAELREVGEAGQRGLKQIEQGARPASEGLDKVARSADGVGRAAPAIGNLSNVVAGFVGGLAAGAVQQGLAMLSRITDIFPAMVAAAREAEDSQRRLQAVLQGTGFTAGFTAEQIISFADAQERATLDTSETIQDAAAVLATFRSVSGDTFLRTIRVAQDLSAVFKDDLQSSVTRLGKALEDPIAGLTALSRVGIMFTDGQKELIRTLEESGQRLQAQQEVLAAVEGQLGPAAAAQASGTTGAVNRLTDAWGNLLEAMGQSGPIAGTVQTVFAALSSTLEGLTNEITGQADSIEERYRRAKEMADGLRKYGEEHPFLSRLGSPVGPGEPTLAQRRADAEVAALHKPMLENLRIQLLTQEAEERQTQLSVEREQTERKINLVQTQRKSIGEELKKLETDPKDKIAAIREEFEQKKKMLEASRTEAQINLSLSRGGGLKQGWQATTVRAGTGGDVDRAIAEAEEVARIRIAAIEEQEAKERASTERRVATSVSGEERKGMAAQRAAEQRARDDEDFLQKSIEKEGRELEAVAKLEDAYADLTRSQMANIDLVLQRQLEANAREISDISHREAADVAATQRAEAEKARLRDETLAGAREEGVSARVAVLDMQARDPRIGEEQRTAAMQEGMEMRIALEREETALRLAELEQVGLSEADSARARADIIMAGEDNIRLIQGRTYQDMGRQLEGVERLANSLTSTLAGGIAELVIAGREGFDSLGDAFQSFLDGVQRQIITQGIQQMIGTAGGPGGGTGLLGMLLGAGTTAAMSSGGGGGGAAASPSIMGWRATWAHMGSPGIPITAPASLWRDAPRLHSGRTSPPNLAPWEQAAIIRRDETIRTPQQEAARETPLNVTINNYSSEPVNTRQDPRGGMQIDIGAVVANALSKPGSSAHQAVRGMIQSEMRSGA